MDDERELAFTLYQESKEHRQKDILYRIMMGLTTLDMVPTELLNEDICITACNLHPMQYLYVPENIRPYFPEELTERCRQELFEHGYDPNRQYVVQNDINMDGIYNELDSIEYQRKLAEINYRINTGDYNHDGVVDKKDKQLEMEGLAFADL